MSRSETGESIMSAVSSRHLGKLRTWIPSVQPDANVIQVWYLSIDIEPPHSQGDR